MKKIVFVQKQQSSTYDPVSTFFANSQNKKASSLAKPSVPIPSSKNTGGNNRAAGSIERPPTTKLGSDKQKKAVQIQQRQKPVTGKIGRKGDHLPPKKQESIQVTSSKKQQSVYGIGGMNSKKNIKSITKQSNEPIQQKHYNPPPPYNDYDQDQLVLPNVNQRRSPNKNNQYGRLNYQQQPTNSQQQPSSQQVSTLRKRIKQLQVCQQQYMRKIQQLQEKQQKYVKMQQKYTKLQKQHKQCGSQTKQTSKKLKQREQQLKKMLGKEEIPYNKKREVLLTNQINNLKKINRELTTRIKNYKGTDLVQLSLNKNKTQILFKEYDHSNMQNQIDQQNQTVNQLDPTRIQSMVFQLVQKIQQYIDAKNSKQIGWSDDRKLLSDLNYYCKQLSLECLNYDWKLPNSNQQCCNLYNQIQRYRHSVQPLISKYDINFIITQANIQFINHKNQQISENLQFRLSLPAKWNEEPKKFKKIAQASAYYLAKCKNQALLYERNSNLNSIILAHCISQIEFMQSWANKVAGALRQSLTHLGVRLKEIEQLCSLGEAGKQSLVLYVKSNIDDLLIRVPDLQLQLKQIGAIFKKAKVPAATKSGR